MMKRELDGIREEKRENGEVGFEKEREEEGKLKYFSQKDRERVKNKRDG